MDAPRALYKIGELARLSGVPVKTIRFYSDSGVLPPASVEESGYRLYSDADHARLMLIRTLREIGIDLPTISRLLQQQISVGAALQMQLAAVEVELRALQRRRALLKVALQQDEAAALRYLDRARALAQLDALDRERFLSAHMERAFEGVPADSDWKARFWQGAVLDLPAEMNIAQLEAWLELAALVTNEDFIRRLNEIGRESWATGGSQAANTWNQEIQQVLTAAIAALEAGHSPQSVAGQQIVAAYIQALNDSDDPDFPRTLLAMIERNSDPRAERYWELIAILKNWQMPPIAAAHRWLVEGLRWRVEQASAPA